MQLGIGLSAYVEITAGGPSSEYGSVELLPGGRIKVTSGATPFGQGHDTVWSMIVADRMGVAMDDVEVVHGDTDLVPVGGLTVGSRSVQLAGAAVADASHKLVEAARQEVAELLEASAEDVVFDPAGGAFHVAGTPSLSVDWAALAERSRVPLSGVSDFSASTPTFPFGAHVAVVEVDTVTGQIRLRPPRGRRRRRQGAQPVAGRGPGARRTRPGHRAGAARGHPLRRGRQPGDHQLRRLPRHLGRRAPDVRGRAHGDTDLRQRARGEGLR